MTSDEMWKYIEDHQDERVDTLSELSKTDPDKMKELVFGWAIENRDYFDRVFFDEKKNNNGKI